jgi:hypothetical protein
VLVRILLDEHISPETAYRLTELGFDVIPLRDRGLLHWEDWELMTWCAGDQRAICTRNRTHFEREHRSRRGRGEEHHGILLVERDWDQEAVYWALRQFLEAGPEQMLLMNQVVELAPATDEFIRERTEDSTR